MATSDVANTSRIVFACSCVHLCKALEICQFQWHDRRKEEDSYFSDEESMHWSHRCTEGVQLSQTEITRILSEG